MIEREDYAEFLKENGLTEESMVDALRSVGVVGEADPKYFVGQSGISGWGVKSDCCFEAGDELCLIHNGTGWTLAGRFANHSHNPNSLAFKHGNQVFLTARMDIDQGDEITADYRQVKSIMEAKV